MRNLPASGLPDGGQCEVDRPDRARALADGGGNPLHRPRPHVTGGEDTGHAGLVGQWSATQQLPGRAEVVARQVAVRMNPSSSTATPRSQSVAGWAPMKQNSPTQSVSADAPVDDVSVTARSASPLCSAVTWVAGWTVIDGCASRRSTR